MVQSASLYRHLEKRDFGDAYKIACLGVTDSDWRQLANEALKSLNLDIARRSYIRLRDTRYIDLVARIEAERRQAGHDDRASHGSFWHLAGVMPARHTTPLACCQHSYHVM